MNNESKLYETTKYRCLVYDQKQTEDIFLTMCGVEHCLPNYEFHARSRPGYHLHVILSGKGTLCVRGEAQSLHFGQMFITKPGEDTWYRADNEDPWVYCWMTFDGHNAPVYAEHAGFRDGINSLECNIDQERFFTLVSRLLDLPELTYANDLIRLGLLLEYLGLAIESSYKGERVVPREYKYSTDAYVEYASNYIRTNYATARIGDVARYVGVHRSYLTNIFKKKLGVSPQEYLMQVRMKRARLLLLETGLPIQEVSHAVGYDNALTFSKVFKNFYGCSPKQYRQQNGSRVSEIGLTESALVQYEDLRS